MPLTEATQDQTAVGKMAEPSTEAQASHAVQRFGHHSDAQAEAKPAPNGAAASLDGRPAVVPGETNGRTDRDDGSPGIAESHGNLAENGEPRRTLHLSLEGARRPDAQYHDAPGSNAPDRPAMRPPPGQQGSSYAASRSSPANYAAANNASIGRAAAEPHQGKEVGAFIDQALRDRVDGDIATFLKAFDAALADDTVENRAGLREATDRLLRAGARTRIELERLEARVPLTARDNAGYAAPAWRPR